MSIRDVAIVLDIRMITHFQHASIIKGDTLPYGGDAHRENLWCRTSAVELNWPEDDKKKVIASRPRGH